MNEIKRFEHEVFGSIRTVDSNGKILFCGKDIATALGYVNPTKAITTHCKGVSKMVIPTSGGKQRLNFIPEGDIYRLVIGSQLPEAEKFESWIFDEVIPQIRKTGGYIPVSNSMTDAEIMASALLIAQKTMQAKDNEILLANDKIRTLEPKANYCDMVLQASGLISVTVIAKDYGMSAIAFNSLLNKLKIQYKKGDQWFLYAKYDGLGYTGSTTAKYEHTSGAEGVAIHTKWTQKGRLFLYNILKEHGYVPTMETEYENYKNGVN